MAIWAYLKHSVKALTWFEFHLLNLAPITQVKHDYSHLTLLICYYTVRLIKYCYIAPNFVISHLFCLGFITMFNPINFVRLYAYCYAALILLKYLYFVKHRLLYMLHLTLLYCLNFVYPYLFCLIALTLFNHSHSV